jgi:hypothetical protein
MIPDFTVQGPVTKKKPKKGSIRLAFSKTEGVDTYGN